MKKCPECGNPSYDGAPVCGNCGYKFPKPKVAAPKEDIIFKQEPKAKKDSSNESTLTIIRNNKLIIGLIVLITLIVICGIVLTSSDNETSSPLAIGNTIEFSEGDFSFSYPGNWIEVNGSDAEHVGAKFFENDNNTIIEYYNVTSDSTSLKDITQQRISYAQQNGAYVELVETITLDGRNSSNIVLENADGNYTRFVSLFSDGELYVFKISGDSPNSVNSDDINTMLDTADIA